MADETLESVITLPQPWKGLISFVINICLGYILALICVKIAPVWLPMDDVIHHLQEAKPENAELIRFLWYHAAEIAGFTLIPFLVWHHYFDDMVPRPTRIPGRPSGSGPWAC